jgi:hypothetical protein
MSISSAMSRRLATLVRTQFLGLLALLIVLTGGTALAASTAAKNSVTSKSIKNGQVRTVDLAPAAVTGDKLAPGSVTTANLGPDSVTTDQVKNGNLTGTDVSDNSLTGSDVNESTLGIVPNASSLGGVPAAAYLRGSVVKKETAVAAGTDLGDGTASQTIMCDAGDMFLSGGPANLSATSDMVESFPAAGAVNGLTVRINKHGVADNWSVVILCLDLP